MLASLAIIHSEISQIWSDRSRTAYYLEFEAALAVAQARAGIIPQEAADAIAAQTIEMINMEELAEETKAIGYPVLPLVRQLQLIPVKDVTDTATVLQLRDTCRLVAHAIKGIVDVLRDLSRKYADTPMAARSNLQQAVPMTFGF
ncbi:hypothetical protein NLJ89_g7769 [Agrocybe chaxingu]|uniref:Fumarate lyase N-terminal domain-containing protein n=1 Tax=Agrocybe chaxingu TaxID=84603 RepID=A0A9W8JWN1_9AGAR|nr:hypothetical protein NLJ89_g7769 [Agrocybe chaxingu]